MSNMQVSQSNSANGTLSEMTMVLSDVLEASVLKQGSQAEIEQHTSVNNFLNQMTSTGSVDDEVTKQDNESFWDKLIGDVIDVCMAVFIVSQVACGDLAGAAVGTVLLVAKLSGAFNDLTTSIASSLENDGMSSKWANVIADAITIVVGIAAGLAVGGTGMLAEKGVAKISEKVGKDAAEVGVKAADSALEEGTEMTDFSADSTDESTTANETTSKEKEGSKEGAKPKSAGKRLAAYSAMSGSSALGQVSGNFAQNFAEIVDPNNKKLVELITLLLELTVAVGGSIGGACYSLSSLGGDTAQMVSGVSKGIQGGSDIVLGGVGIASGITTEQLAHTGADIAQDSGFSKMINHMSQENFTTGKQSIQMMEQMLQETDLLFAAQTAAAQAMI
jgi:hypothetical protein